jgi:hypothetical protein
MATALATKAMVMNLSIGVWNGQRLDKEATRKVTDDAGADPDAARVNKHLVAKSALAAIVTASSAIRSHFYDKTLPWRDNGDRLMPRKMYESFIPEHEALVDAFEQSVETFLTDEYQSAIAKAEFRMGTMFKRDDYPRSYILREKFYAKLDIDAVTTAGDFRVEIDQADADKVRAGMEAAMEQRMQAAAGDVWKRMAEAVARFQERMADPKAIFRDSTVTNIADMLDLVPGLNVLDDPNIEAVRAAIANSLGGIDAKSIRKDPELRTELAGEAQTIMDTMAGFMSAFGGGQE